MMLERCADVLKQDTGERDGTSDQYHRFVLSVMDALRFDRDWRGSARTVALCSDGTRSLCRPATTDLLESCHSRYSRALGGFFQGLALWLKKRLHQIQAPVVPLAD